MLKNKKAFTLVELIVVITILAILGTISFVSLQGFSKEARDSKRITDTRNLLSKIDIESVKGTQLTNLIKSATTLSGQILGEKDKEYNSFGKANFETLKEQSSNFKDPLNSEQDYPLAFAEGVSNVNGKKTPYKFIQIATISEKDNVSKVYGNYYTIDGADIPSLFMTGGIYIEDNKGGILPYIPDSTGSDNGDGEIIVPKPTSCEIGYYVSGSECVEVEEGYYSPEGATEQTRCSGNKTPSAPTSASSDDDCDVCMTGHTGSTCTTCTSGYKWNSTESMCQSTTRQIECGELPEKGLRYSTNSNEPKIITQSTSNFETWNPTTTPTRQNNSGANYCYFWCESGYERNPSTELCETRTREATCGELPQNAVRSSSNSEENKTITQTTSNFTTYSPTTEPSYNTSSAVNYCYYKCSPGFALDGGVCIPSIGKCGSANHGMTSSIPSTNLCESGTSTNVRGSGPWSWNCIGANGGTIEYCFSGKTSIGTCGTGDGATLSSQPSGNQLCIYGTPEWITTYVPGGSNGPWQWKCVGEGGESICAAASSLICNGEDYIIGGLKVARCNSTTGQNLYKPHNGNYYYQYSTDNSYTPWIASTGCESPRRLPTYTEMGYIRNAISGINGTTPPIMYNIPAAGGVGFYNYESQGRIGWYWSGNAAGLYSKYALKFDTTTKTVTTEDQKYYFPVRCIRD